MDEKELMELTEFAEMYKAHKAMKLKTPASTNTAPLLFGAGGLFTTQGLEPDIITAYVRPFGLAAQIPHLPSVTEQPIFGTITGVQSDTHAAVDYPCDDAPSGYLKGCELTARFGRLQFDTQTMEWDKIFTQLNNGVSTDLQLRGRLLGMVEQFQPSGLSDTDVLNLVVASEMVKVGMMFARGTTTQMGLSRQTWQGNIANNSANGGYMEFPGLDGQITTGHVDATTNTTCPAVDSDIKQFNYSNISNGGVSPVDGVTRDIVEYLSMLEFYLYYNSYTMGLDPVEWVVVMRPELWQELTAIWPIAYNTNRGAVLLNSASTVVQVDGGDMIAERDRMRNGMYIDINGRRHKVVTDVGIFERFNGNDANVPVASYASDIYMVPLTITGGFPVTYFEYKDYRTGLRDIAALMGREDFWTDRGMFSWAIENVKWCFKLSAKTERRIVLRTPQLAGRITRVLYTPLQHLREPFDDSSYYMDGGVSTRAIPTRYSVWNSSGQTR